MTAVYQKELRSYFNNLFGYLYIALVLLFMGFFATAYHFKNYYFSNISYSLQNLAFILLLVTPLLTMRIIAEERQKKTDTLLYSLPVSITSTILGKYFAMLTVYLIPIGVMSVYPIVLSWFGDINFAGAYNAIFGIFLMGASLLAIGMFISSLTENQVVSAILTFVVMLVIYFSGSLSMLVPATASASFLALTVVIILFGILIYAMLKNYLVAIAFSTVCEVIMAVVYATKQAAFEGLFGKIISHLSVFDTYAGFLQGILDLSAVVYYLSVIFLFVFLSIQSVEKRRWS